MVLNFPIITPDELDANILFVGNNFGKVQEILKHTKNTGTQIQVFQKSSSTAVINGLFSRFPCCCVSDLTGFKSSEILQVFLNYFDTDLMSCNLRTIQQFCNKVNSLPDTVFVGMRGTVYTLQFPTQTRRTITLHTIEGDEIKLTMKDNGMTGTCHVVGGWNDPRFYELYDKAHPFLK